jgi:hypothetical protein
MRNSLIEFYVEEMADLEEQVQEEADLEDRDLSDEGDHSTGRYEAVIQVEKLIKEKLELTHQEIMEFYENGKIEDKSLKDKLQWLEDQGITFQAKYRGAGEVFTAGPFGMGGFLDYHWLEDAGSRGQEIKPTELERIVDETVEAKKEEIS